jgi:hypothetical protein
VLHAHPRERTSIESSSCHTVLFILECLGERCEREGERILREGGRERERAGPGEVRRAKKALDIKQERKQF